MIEILVVILILGVLLALAIPAYLSATVEARVRATRDNALMIAKGIQSCRIRLGGDGYKVVTAPLLLAEIGGSIPLNPCTRGGSRIWENWGLKFPLKQNKVQIEPAIDDPGLCPEIEPIVLER